MRVFRFALPLLAPLFAAGALLTPTASGQMLGQVPPELDAVKWYNSPPLRLEDLRERAVLVEVFRTW